MIARLRGILLEKRPGSAVIDVGGVGYQVTVALETYEALGDPGERVEIHVHTHVREEQLALFGFHDARGKFLFTSLLNVNGVGPRLAIAVLSGLGVRGLIETVRRRDARRLASVPGIGRKTAERLLLEIGDRFDGETTDESVEGSTGGGELRHDVASALTNLGYNPRVAEDAVRRAMRAPADESSVVSFENLLRQSLRLLSR